MTTKQKPINVQRANTNAQSLLRKGEFIAAANAYSEILESYPQNHKAKNGLAGALRMNARQQRPNLTRQIVDQMFAMRTEGKLAEAMKEARLLSTAYPEEAVLHNFLATCCFETGEFENAKAACLRALAVFPDYPEAHLNMAIASRISGQFKLALKHNQKAIQLRPQYALAYSNLGLLEEALNHPADAIVSIEKAIAIDPKAAEHHNNLGFVYRSIGQTAKAAACFEKSVELNPAAAEVHCNLSDLKTYKTSDPHIGQMEALFSQEGENYPGNFPLGFALAKAYEDTNQHQRSFETLLVANRLRKMVFPYMQSDTEQQFTQIMDFHENGTTNPSLKPLPEGAKKPLFILGLPRSGTTLVEQIIASHSKVFGAGEIEKLGKLFEAEFAPNKTVADTLDELKLEKKRTSYLKQLNSYDVNEQIITDKLPLNFRWVGFIVAMFPNAKIIHVKRDTMAVCWSMFKRRFAARGNGFAYDLDDLAHYVHQCQKLMDFWIARYPENVLTVDYDILTENQKDETARMLDFLGLDWEEQCMSFEENKRSVRSASAEQVRQKMYTGSSQAWKTYEQFLKPLQEKLATTAP